MTRTRSGSSIVVPDSDDVRAASRSLPPLRDYLSRHTGEHEITIVVENADVEPLVVPRQAAELLAKILAHMAQGEAVSVLPSHAELTTQQAADLLNVSRPYLIKLVECGEIEHRRVGTHRRVRMDSLVDYMRRDDARRRGAADELSAMTQEMGLI